MGGDIIDSRLNYWEDYVQASCRMDTAGCKLSQQAFYEKLNRQKTEFEERKKKVLTSIKARKAAKKDIPNELTTREIDTMADLENAEMKLEELWQGERDEIQEELKEKNKKV